MHRIKVIGFDADDTLWVNEPYYRQVESEFCMLMKDFDSEEEISKTLFQIEMKNLVKYGYGAKGFMLSMIEAAIQISANKVSPETISQIIDLGKDLLEKPIELLGDIEKLLNKLKEKYLLIVATKGDLLDQQRKLDNSGLLHHFHHIEIMHDKKETEYQKLISRLGIKNEEFLMVGNSLKSDVLPLISIGAHAIHVPYHITWQHEKIHDDTSHLNYHEISNLDELLYLLQIDEK